MAETLYKPAAVDMPTAGKNYLLYLNVGTNEKAGAKWLLLGGQRSGDLSRKADSIDASHKGSGGWNLRLQALKSGALRLKRYLCLKRKA